MTKRKNRALFALLILNIALALLVIILHKSKHKRRTFFSQDETMMAELPDTMQAQREACDALLWSHFANPQSLQHKAQNSKARLYRVSSFPTAFPDINDLQLATAQMFGIEPPQSRHEIAQRSSDELVYIGHSPYYHVDSLTSSAPYLTPSAQIMLTRIGRNFTDSLFAKRINPALPIVTSVTRSIDDVAQLQHRNRNATTNSCHSYGTTVDISYNRFRPIVRQAGDTISLALGDTLKAVLSEVLRDLRQQGVCFVKYEKRQACFHITVR